MSKRWATTWRDYVRGMAVGKNSLSRMARAVDSLNGNTPESSRKILEKQLRAGEIDGEAYAWRVECVDELERMRQTQAPMQAAVMDGSWIDLGNGGRMRKDMKDKSA